MKDWLKQVPAEDREHYAKIGMLSSFDMSAKPALIIVDFTLGFSGRRGVPLAEAVKEFPTACGPTAWAAVPPTAQLAGLFRALNLPIVYTFADTDDMRFAGSISSKMQRSNWPPPQYNDFPEEISPREGEWVLGKCKASAFFGTPLNVYLTRHSIGTVVVCGGSTSGCVRATAVDAAQSGYRTFVVDDCCFDRSNYAHCANLFDLQAKYATVVSAQELEHLMNAGERKASAVRG
jgi:maleamate amidohydrolase